MKRERGEYRVLVADDSAANRMLLGRILRKLGLQVRDAGDGAEAVTEARLWQPHLILMDVNMPLATGVEALRRIRSELPETAPRVVAVTGDSSAQGDGFYLGQGFDEVVRKPFGQKQISAVISRQLGIDLSEEPGAPGALAPAAQPPGSPRLAPQIQRQIHDLRNALTAIKGHAELLAEERGNLCEEMVDSSIQEIVAQAQRLEEGLSTLEGYLTAQLRKE